MEKPSDYPSQKATDENKHPSTEDPQTNIRTFVSGVPVTGNRRPFQDRSRGKRLIDPGTSRATIAASRESPNGTLTNDWTTRHQHQTILQQHCTFFDPDHDNIIYPSDTYRGFHKLGFGMLLSLLAVFIIHPAFSYASLNSYIPDPYFRINIANIHRCKHGSDSGAYDTEGRFVPQKFEEIFSKYADGKDCMDVRQLWHFLKGQRLLLDPVGWIGVLFEWLALYLMLWPEDGRLKKEDIRRVYDGSIFYTIAARRAMNELGRKGD